MRNADLLLCACELRVTPVTGKDVLKFYSAFQYIDLECVVDLRRLFPSVVCRMV